MVEDAVERSGLVGLIRYGAPSQEVVGSAPTADSHRWVF